MSKRVIIIHGWSEHPQEAWFPWLKRELESKAMQVQVPAMPITDQPQIDAWINKLVEVIGQPDQQTYLVGHSIGVQTILRYLEMVTKPVGGVLSVAGWYYLNAGSLSGPEEESIVQPWVETPINNELVRKNAGLVRAIFSDNDPYVDLENAELFEQRLGSVNLVLHNKGHLGAEDNLKEVPEILAELMKIIGSD